MQATGTVWTTLIGDHPGIIPVKFGQIPISGSREDGDHPGIIPVKFGQNPISGFRGDVV